MAALRPSGGAGGPGPVTGTVDVPLDVVPVDVVLVVVVVGVVPV